MSIEDLTCLIVILLVVIFILRLISEKKEPKQEIEPEVESYAGSGPAYSDDKDEVTLPVKKDDKNEGTEYIELITGELIGESARRAHNNYNAKRRAAGDHTLQLWGINDSKRGYSTNYVGFRPPRRIPLDPTSALQPGTSDMSDYIDPQTKRFI